MKMTQRMKPRALPLLALFACVIAFPARSQSQEPKPYSGSAWALLDSKAVMAAAADIDLKHLPDCDEATVDQKSMRVIRADGTGEAQDDTYMKVLTEDPAGPTILGIAATLQIVGSAILWKIIHIEV